MTRWFIRHFPTILAGGCFAFLIVMLGSALIEADRDLLWP